MIVYHCPRRFIFRRPFVWYSVCLSVCLCLSVCMYVHMYICRDERTSVCTVDIEIWIDLTDTLSRLYRHWALISFFFSCRGSNDGIDGMCTFLCENCVYDRQKVHKKLWAITLYYSTSRLWQWRKVNPKPVSWYLKLCTKTYYDLTVGPPCFIEHELYVENAGWILRTFSTRKCSSN